MKSDDQGSTTQSPSINCPVVYSTSSATADEILTHLRACSDDFVPPLAQRVNLHDYASKLSMHSTTFEAWCGDLVVGLVAGYFNTATGFISNVSVMKKHHDQGIASNLLKRCHQEAENRGIPALRLEVSSDNVPATNLYKKLGYEWTRGDNGPFMECNLERK